MGETARPGAEAFEDLVWQARPAKDSARLQPSFSPTRQAREKFVFPGLRPSSCHRTLAEPSHVGTTGGRASLTVLQMQVVGSADRAWALLLARLPGL